VFESRVLRKIFGHNREEMRGDLRKLRNDEPQQMLRTFWADEMDGARVTCGERSGVYSVQGFGGEVKGKLTTWEA
jgi:hypothetical protein